MAERQVTIRVKVAGDRVTQTFRLYGQEGEKALSRISAAARAQNSVLDGNARTFRKASGAANHFTGGMRNMSLQLSQVAQQASATGNWVQALAIQLPDLALGFGTLGIAIGVIAGAALPLLADRLMGGSETAQTMEDRVKELEAATTAYRRAAENAAKPTAELREEFGTAANAARQYFEVQQRFRRLDMITALQEARSELSNLVGDVSDIEVAQATAFSAFQRRIRELTTGVFDDRGVDTRTAEQLNELRNLETLIAPLESAVARVREEIGLTGQAAADFVANMVRFRDAAGPEAVEVAVQLTRTLTDAAAADGKITEAERERIVLFNRAIEQMLLFKAAAEDSAATISGAGAETTRLADEVGRAARAAIDFVSNLGQASLAGLRAEVAALESGANKVAARVARREAEIRSSDEFQRALQGPEGLRREALAGLEAELQLERESVELTERRSAALREVSSAARGAASGAQQLTAAQRLANQVLGEGAQAAVTYADVVAVLDEKLRSGEISQAAYNQALERARERLTGIGDAADNANQRFGDLAAGVLTGAQDMDRVLAQLGQRLLSMAFGGLFESSGIGSFLGDLFGFAEGTSYAPGGMAMVGERGPELMRLPRGAQVIPAGRTQAMMQGRPARVEVVARVENGNIVQTIREVAGDVAVRTMQAGFRDYDRNVLPGSVKRISNDPRRRG